jgi:beta-lactamase superfamily II metal-dependent hydrolase
MLIDCGTRGGAEAPVKSAIKHLEQMLPETGEGKRRLDLLIATHKHDDHIKGFDPINFEKIKIENLWITVAMDPTHKQAEKTRGLHAFATNAMREIASLNIALSGDEQALVELFSLSLEDAAEALRKTLPQKNGIKPVFVYAGQDPQERRLPLSGATIRVLGPEYDIDRFYLGKKSEETIHALEAAHTKARSPTGREPSKQEALPQNISRTDFRLLQSRMLSNAFAFADLYSRVTNNTSVVLLIEWKGKRLLFVGDAEWKPEFKDGIQNGAWNVMWHERKDAINAPVDFLKIGHHGSTNSTPWNESGNMTEPGTILDSILPLPSQGAKPKAQAIVSTKRKNYPDVPKSALLVELGRRVTNIRNYREEFEARGKTPSDLPGFEQYEKAWLGRPQPWRTDCEFILTGDPFVDVEIEA